MPSRIPTFRPSPAPARSDYESAATRMADKRFYAGRHWLRLRNLVRREEPLCRSCAAKGLVAATEHIDHIIDRKDRPDLAYNRDNLQGLCKRCHNAKRGSLPPK